MITQLINQFIKHMTGNWLKMKKVLNKLERKKRLKKDGSPKIRLLIKKLKLFKIKIKNINRKEIK